VANAAEFWLHKLGPICGDHPWIAEAHAIADKAEKRRAEAKFNTGSITITAALAIRAIAHWCHAETVVEVGTFIGNSTLALKAEAKQVYTCDFSNDCFEPHEGIRTFPHYTSLQMFAALAKFGVMADLCFFDGRLGPADPSALAKITTPHTVYLFDDYDGHEKGVCNVELLQPHLPDHELIEPAGVVKADTTLAVLVPRSMR
jgi:hypothetical protein